MASWTCLRRRFVTRGRFCLGSSRAYQINKGTSSAVSVQMLLLEPFRFPSLHSYISTTFFYAFPASWFNGKIPIGRVDLWRAWSLATETHKAVHYAVKDEFEQLSTKDAFGIPSEVDVDITGSIINLENFSHNPTMQQRVLEKIRVAVEGILSGVTVDQYLLPMPPSRLKGWEKKDREKKEKDLGVNLEAEGENSGNVEGRSQPKGNEKGKKPAIDPLK